ncbi:MAG: murein biosynthesis integral membrane protein MurJ [Rhizobiaceae bacterium]|nr:murein biosynthesis integral membrane protein MurJ [Rhizobiaceae bacterium]
MSLFRKFASVGGATMASRVLGFVREAMIAAFLGAGPVADAFYAAFRFPNLFRRLFAEGAFNSAFVPLFASELETGGREAAREFAEKILSFLLLVLLGVSALAMIFMPFLVGTIIAPKFIEDPDKFDLTILLTRIMFPYLAAMSVVAMLSGILNAFRRYFLAAFAPVVLNVILIAVLVATGLNGFEHRDIGIAMAWGVFLAGIMQLLLLIYGIRKEGFPLSIRVPRLSPSVKRLLVLALPTALAGGITQINLLVGQIIASAQAGGIAIMNYADRLMQLPLGIIGISIGVVLLPELTRALAGENRKEAMQLQNRSLEFGLGLTIPAAVGLFMIPLPLITLIYERGAFDRETSELTAQVLAAFAIGLPSFVLIKIFQPSFYARQDMKTPMWFSGVNAVSNIILALVLFPIYGVVGLALATSAAGWINAFLLWFVLVGGKHFDFAASTVRNLSLICIASVAMAGVLYVGDAYLSNSLVDGRLLLRLGTIGGLIIISAIVYFAIVIMTGAIPRQQLARMFRRN